MAERTENPHVVFFGKGNALREKMSPITGAIGSHVDQLTDSSARFIKPKSESIRNEIHHIADKIHNNTAVVQLEKRAHEGMKAVTPVINDTKQTIHGTYERDVKPKAETILSGVKKAIEWHAPKRWESRVMNQYDSLLPRLPKDKQTVAKRIRPAIEKAAHIAGFAITGTEVAVILAAACGTVYAIKHSKETAKQVKLNKSQQTNPITYAKIPTQPENIQFENHEHTAITTPIEIIKPKYVHENDWNYLSQTVTECLNKIPSLDITKPYIAHEHTLVTVINRLLRSKYGEVPSNLDNSNHTFGNPREYLEQVFQTKSVQDLFDQSVLGATNLWNLLSKDYPRRKHDGITSRTDPTSFRPYTVYPDDEVVRFMLDVADLKRDVPVLEVHRRLEPLIQAIYHWVITENFHIDKHWKGAIFADRLAEQFLPIADHFKITN